MKKLGLVINSISELKESNLDNIAYIELSDNGYTPGITLLNEVKAYSNLPVICMVKKNCAFYTMQDLDEVYDRAKELISNGADGLVCDFKNSDGSLDYSKVSRMRRFVKDKALIYHLELSDLMNELNVVQELVVIEAESVVLKGDLDKYLKRINRLKFEYGEVINIILETNDLNKLMTISDYTNINTMQYQGNSRV